MSPGNGRLCSVSCVGHVGMGLIVTTFDASRFPILQAMCKYANLIFRAPRIAYPLV
jgi:hypothetical protein